MTGIESILLISLAAGLGLGYITGKAVERRAWNELIKRGVIPTPNGGQ